MARPVPGWRKLERLNLHEVPEGFGAGGRLAEIERFWRQKAEANGGLPTASDFAFEALRPWIGFVSLVDVEGEPPRFRWRLVGSRIAEFMGRDVSGRRFDEIYEGSVLEDYNRHYATAVVRRAPVWFRGDLEFVDREFFHFNSVHLPLANAAGEVHRLALSLEFDR